MTTVRKLCAALLLCAATSAAQAIIVQHELTQGAGNHWTVKFDITNDGSLPEVSNFTVYFDWAYASNLQLLASPGTWDTIVIEPDTALSSDGFVDALVLDPVDALLTSQSLGGFELEFDWAAAASPASFQFTVNDPDTLEVLESGSSIRAAHSIPEPATGWVAALGLGLILSQRRTRLRS